MMPNASPDEALKRLVLEAANMTDEYAGIEAAVKPPDSPHETIDLWIRCKNWKVLPVSGGMMSQPWLIMNLFTMYENITQEIADARSNSAQK